MNEPWLPSDLEDLLRAERERPAEAPAALDRLRAHVEGTMGPFDGGDGGGHDGGSDPSTGGVPGASAATGGAAKALAAKLVVTAIGALAVGGVAGANWQASRDARPVVVTQQAATVTEIVDQPPLPSVIAPAPAPSTSTATPVMPAAPQTATAVRDRPAPERAESLAAERTLIDVARTAAALGKTDEALAALERHSRRFPSGVMAEEREGLRVQVLAAAGRTAEARDGAAHFKKQFPKSLLLPAVEGTLRAGSHDDAAGPALLPLMSTTMQRASLLSTCLALLGVVALGHAIACEQTQLLEKPAAPDRADAAAGPDAHEAVVDASGSPLLDAAIDALPDAEGALPEVVATGAGSVLSVAVDATRLFWAGFDSRALMAAPKQGGQAITLAQEAGRVIGVTVDDDHVYWTVSSTTDTGTDGAIKSLPTSGSGPATVLVSGRGGPFFITHDATRIYWTETNGSVFALAKGGGTPTRLGTGNLPTSIALSADDVFWADGMQGLLQRVPKLGGMPSTVVQPGAQGIPSVAADDQRVYWLQNDPTTGGVFSALLTGGSPVAVSKSSQTASFLAVGARDVYWTILAGGAVARAPKQGGASVLVAVTVQQANLTGGAITLDDAYAYWSSGDGTLWRLRTR